MVLLVKANLNKQKGVISIKEERCVMCGNPVPEGKIFCYKCENIEPDFNTTKITVLLDKISDIPKFVELASKCSEDVVVKSGNFSINAKSIMGLYSIDLTNPFKVEFYGNIPYEVREGMKKFIVN